MKSKPIVRAVLAFFAFLAPALVSAAAVGVSVSGGGSFFGISFGSGGGVGSFGGCSSTICSIGTTFIYIINAILVPLLFAAAFITFMYGVARAYIFSKGDATKIADGHRIILWGVVAFAIMISIWGLVNIVANTFGLQGYYAPVPPTSY